jgi:hypothetical protein
VEAGGATARGRRPDRAVLAQQRHPQLRKELQGLLFLLRHSHLDLFRWSNKIKKWRFAVYSLIWKQPLRRISSPLMGFLTVGDPNIIQNYSNFVSFQMMNPPTYLISNEHNLKKSAGVQYPKQSRCLSTKWIKPHGFVFSGASA